MRAPQPPGLRPPPAFVYQPFVEADEVLRALDGARPDIDHPAGRLVARAVDLTRLLCVALRDRTAAAFHALNEAEDWYPEPSLLLSAPADDEREPVRPDTRVPPGEVVAALEAALHARGLQGWQVVPDRVMSARVLVDGAKRIVRVHARGSFGAADIERLVVHEIDVHATRAMHGEGQALLLFQTGLPGSLPTEEGLALLAERRAGVASAGQLARQWEVCRAIDLARNVGFAELHADLLQRMGPSLAWGICQRVKRGLARPDQPGVYAKDSVYLRGLLAAHRRLDEGLPIAHLYVGKVGVDDPVKDWLEDGWVQPRPVPALWALSPPG